MKDFHARRQAAQHYRFATGDATADALRQQLAQRMNLLDPESLLRLDEANLRQLAAELDEDAAMLAADLNGTGWISDEELQRQALQAGDGGACSKA